MIRGSCFELESCLGQRHQPAMAYDGAANGLNLLPLSAVLRTWQDSLACGPEHGMVALSMFCWSNVSARMVQPALFMRRRTTYTPGCARGGGDWTRLCLGELLPLGRRCSPRRTIWMTMGS